LHIIVQRDCDPDYLSHWCTHSIADCSAAGAAHANCAPFSELCDNGAPVADAGTPDGSRRNGGDGTNGTGSGNDPEAGLIITPPAGKHTQAGCGSCATSTNVPSPWFLLFVGLWFTRHHLARSKRLTLES